MVGNRAPVGFPAYGRFRCRFHMAYTWRGVACPSLVPHQIHGEFVRGSGAVRASPPPWRPFVHMFYGAIYQENTDAPPGCIWTRQIMIPLTLIKAFLAENVGSLQRHFSLQTHLRKGDLLTITTDASPHGIGGILQSNGAIVSYFADKICDTDRHVLGLDVSPSASDQQALEALAVLVALRVWRPHWLNRGVNLSVQTDNVAALTTLTKMQPHSATLGIIARELALDISASSYSPDDARHIPGLANTTADYLSRMFSPKF